MTNEDKIKKVCTLLGLQLVPGQGCVAIAAWDYPSYGYSVYSRHSNAVRGLGVLCSQLLECKTLAEANKHIAKRQLGIIRADGTWSTCNGVIDMFRIPGHNNTLANVKTLARKVKKILDQ